MAPDGRLPQPTRRAGQFQTGIEKRYSSGVMPGKDTFPAPIFAKARLDQRSRMLPQCIAHRGYKARFPENTLLAFDEALKAGAQALETDLHLSKDSVVVLSHDKSLRRCFGNSDRLLSRTWNEMKDLRTLAPPHVAMPRLKDLLEFLLKPGRENVWVILDIKLNNDAESIMRSIGSTIAEVKPWPGKGWNERIVLGIWAAKYLALAEMYLPGFSIVYVGYKASYARRFMNVPHIGFNLLNLGLMAPGGRRFIKDCKSASQRPIIAWTVNSKEKMEWFIRRKVDGVITDDPDLFRTICEKHDDTATEPLIPVGLRTLIDIARIYVLLCTLFWVFRLRRLKPDSSLTRRAGRSQG